MISLADRVILKHLCHKVSEKNVLLHLILMLLKETIVNIPISTYFCALPWEFKPLFEYVTKIKLTNNSDWET